MKSRKNNFLDLTEYQIIPEGSRASYFWIAEVVANYCYQKHYFLPINTLCILQYKDSKWILYYAVKDRRHFQKILQRFSRQQSLMLKIENYITAVRENTVRRITKCPIDSLTDKQLGSLLKFYYLQNQEIHKAAMTLRLIDRGARDYFQNIFTERGLDDKSHILASSKRKTFSTQEHIALLRLAEKIATGSIQTSFAAYKKELHKIYERFCWLTLGYYSEPLPTIADYDKRVKMLSRKQPVAVLKNIFGQVAAEQKDRNKILQSATIELKKVATVAAESSYLKDYFKFSTNKIQYYGEAIFQEIARRKKTEVSELKNLAHQDAINLIVGRPINSPATRKSYVRHSIFLSLTGKINRQYIGKQADRYESLFLTHQKNTSGEFKGRTACPGRATGRAKIVHSPHDFHKVKKGDIIVVMNTGPDFVPVLSRVGAIVAEEGGITAHVSVISREMKIPCVVGLAKITKEIKDGDRLEVNADKGIIRKI